MIVGIDLGGTKIAAVLLDEQQQTLRELTVPTQAHEGPDAVTARIAETVRAICREAGLGLDQIGAVGVGVPAVIDYARGMTMLMPNLPGDWHEKPIVGDLHAALGPPVHLINDARAFALAEATFGAGKGARFVACFTLGTGIGGGLVIDGRLHMGLNGVAAEFGHQTIDPHGPRCGCGNIGCLEAIASGPAITTAGARVVLQGITSQIGLLTENDIRKITPGIIAQAADAGDVQARDILERTGIAIGIGLANVITFFSPEVVVIGGGLAELGDWLLAPARAEVRRRCHTTPVDQIQIVRAGLGRYAGAMGAAAWAGQGLQSQSKA